MSVCWIAVGKCAEMFTEMFKAAEVGILHNLIKMCILVITESETNTKKIWERMSESKDCVFCMGEFIG